MTEKNRSCLWCASALAGYQPLLVVLPANRGRRRGLGVDGPIDQQYLKTPFYGSRRMTAWLRNHGPGQPQAGPPADAADRPGGHLLAQGIRSIRLAQGAGDQPGCPCPEVWATDITYIPMARGFLYLMAIMDWHSRYVLAWRLSNTLEVDFCVGLWKGLEQRPQIFNTGGQPVHQRGLHQHAAAQGVQVSMDGPDGQRLRGTAVAQHQVRGGVPEAYQNGTEARKGMGLIWPSTTKSPHQALGYRSPGQVFQVQ